MRKRKTAFLGLTRTGLAAAAVLIAVVLALIGCGNLAGDDGNQGNGNQGNGNGNGNGGTSPVINGSFSYGEKTVTFHAQEGSTARSVTRAAAPSATQMTGKISDGETVFDLDGFYLSSTGDFVLSAGSASLVFEIVGDTSNGAMSNTDANVKTNDGTSWEAFPDLTVATASDINITATASSEQLDGLPANWIGRWVSGSNSLDVTPFSILAYGADAILPLDLLEITQKTSTKFDILTQGPQNVMIPCENFGPDGCGGHYGGCTDCVMMVILSYSKIRLEQSGNNLILTALGTLTDPDLWTTEPEALEHARTTLDIDTWEEPFTRTYSK